MFRFLRLALPSTIVLDISCNNSPDRNLFSVVYIYILGRFGNGCVTLDSVYIGFPSSQL